MRKMIVVALFALAACQHTLTQAERQTAELGARQYSQASDRTFVSCSGLDSNGDNYVTCTTKDKTGAVVEIVCSFADGAIGCKEKE